MSENIDTYRAGKVARNIVFADLINAEHLIRANGLHKGGLHDRRQVEAGTTPGKARLCMGGAIRAAVTGRPDPQLFGDNAVSTEQRNRIYAAEAAVCHRLWSVERFSGLPSAWNDRLCTSAADAASLLKSTAHGLPRAMTAASMPLAA